MKIFPEPPRKKGFKTFLKESVFCLGIFILLGLIFSYIGASAEELAKIFTISLLAYFFIFRHMISDQRAKFTAANRILAFVDGLYFSELDDLLKRPCCSFTDLRTYITDQLLEFQRVSTRTNTPIEYISSTGFRYASWGGERDYANFAMICIAQYAKKLDNADLLEWCESRLRRADTWHWSAHFPIYYTK